MNNNISLADFKDEVNIYNHFTLELNDALKTMGVQMDYDNISIYLSSFPCISLKNKRGRTTLKYIYSIEKLPNMYEYTAFNIRCKEYLGKGRYVYTNYNLFCH